MRFSQELRLEVILVLEPHALYYNCEVIAGSKIFGFSMKRLTLDENICRKLEAAGLHDRDKYSMALVGLPRTFTSSVLMYSCPVEKVFWTFPFGQHNGNNREFIMDIILILS